MRGLYIVAALATVWVVGCGGSDYHGKEYSGKVTGKVTGENAQQYANMDITFNAKEGGKYYMGTVKGDLTFELTAPPGEYTVVLGTVQIPATIKEGANTVEVDSSKARPFGPDGPGPESGDEEE